MSRSRTLYTTVSPVMIALRAFKEQHKMTWAEIAQELHITLAKLMWLVSGEELTLGTLKRLAQFFNWTAAEVGAALMFEPPPRGRMRGKKRKRKVPTRQLDPVVAHDVPVPPVRGRDADGDGDVLGARPPED